MILFQWFSIFYTHFSFFPIIYSIRAGTIIISAYLFFFLFIYIWTGDSRRWQRSRKWADIIDSQSISERMRDNILV